MFRNVIMIMIILILLNLSLKENLGNLGDLTGGNVGSCSKRFECKEVCNDLYEDNQERRRCKTLCENKHKCR